MAGIMPFEGDQDPFTGIFRYVIKDKSLTPVVVSGQTGTIPGWLGLDDIDSPRVTPDGDVLFFAATRVPGTEDDPDGRPVAAILREHRGRFSVVTSTEEVVSVLTTNNTVYEGHFSALVKSASDDAFQESKPILLLTSLDRDGDGLLDIWETEGIDISPDDANIDLDLKALGADPDRKDVFLEIDYMTNAWPTWVTTISMPNQDVPRDFNDWAHIQYSFRQTINYDQGVDLTRMHLEMDWETYQALTALAGNNAPQHPFARPARRPRTSGSGRRTDTAFAPMAF